MDKNIISQVHDYYDTRIPQTRYKNTVRSSCADISSDEYEILYELINTGNIYTKKVALLRKLLHQYFYRKSPNSPLPLLFRQAIYFLSYELCQGDYYSIAQKKVLEDLNLSHNMFTKWNMHPKQDFDYDYFSSVPLPLFYDGKKITAYNYMIRYLSRYIKYDTFLDVFGGSGYVSMNFPHKKNCKYYINDLDPFIFNYYTVLANDSERFYNGLIQLCKHINAHEDSNILELGQKKINEQIKRQQKNIDSAKANPIKGMDTILAQSPLDRINTLQNADIKITYAKGLYAYFSSIKTKTKKKKNKDRIYEHGNIEKAIAFSFLNGFSERGKISISAVTSENLEKYFSNIRQWKDIFPRFKNVSLLDKAMDAINFIQQFNTKSTLLYLDPPYIGTKNYTEKFPDEYYVSLRKALKSFEGYWIFSCRVSVTSPNEYIDSEQLQDILWLLKLYKGLAQNVIFFKDKNSTYKEHFEQTNAERVAEVMLFNFDVKTPPRMDQFWKIESSKKTGAIHANDQYEILPYDEFFSIVEPYLDR